jgi:hypothetical protein
MSISQEVVHDTLLLGSFPAESTEAAFLQLSGALGDYASRVPDGEIGARRMWIGWQEHVLKDHRQFEAVHEDGSRRAEHRKMPDGTAIPPRYRLREGISAEEVVFAELGYVEVARESYEIFSKLKKAGKIPAKTRYQVSLPTSVAFLEHLVVTESQQITELAYEKRLFAEVKEIAAAVPPEELAIQWMCPRKWRSGSAYGRSISKILRPVSSNASCATEMPYLSPLNLAYICVTAILAKSIGRSRMTPQIWWQLQTVCLPGFSGQ